jgi:hypothetical protein
LTALTWEEGVIGRIETFLLKRFPIGKMWARSNGLTMVSSALSDVILEDFMGDVRPNVFVLYIAVSGLGCKTPPIKMIRRMIAEFDRKILSATKFTPEGFTEWVLGVSKKKIKKGYGESICGGLSPEEQRQRNKALTSLLYLSARRVSEIVGRKYKDYVYDGVMLSDFREDILDGQDVLIMNCRILKKWNRKKDVAKIHYGDVIMDMADEPFIGHILSWLERQKEEGEIKYVSLGRNRVYKILHELSPKIVGPHWLRHMRLTHLAETLDIYELKSRIGFWESIDPAVAYVHGRVGKYLDACKAARGGD